MTTGVRDQASAGDLPAFLFDPNRCTGCAACSLACSTENGLGWGRSWRQIVPFNPERRPGVPSFHLSLACNHCTEAPCVAHCPTGAMTRDPRTGAVVVDDARCIGCRYCAWVCPYDAPRFDEGRGVMAKCTLCNHRLLEDRAPACVEACPTDALEYGVPDARPESQAPWRGRDEPIWLPEIPGFPPTSAQPRVAFAALRRGGGPPPSTWALPDEVAAAFGPGCDAYGPWGPNRITFRAELPLLAFTSGAAALVGWVMAAVLGGSAVHPLAFGVAAAATLLVSVFHLARAGRAWRAVTNVRTSHLSREIVGYGAFLGCAGAWAVARDMAAAGGEPGALAPVADAVVPGLGWAALAMGALALVLVDRVYDPVRPRRARPLHAGDVILMGPLVAAGLLGAWLPFLLLAATKTALYLRESGFARRRDDRDGRDRPTPGDAAGATWWLAGVAVAGLAVPLLIWTASPAAWPGWALLAAAAGAVADRIRLYLALRIPTPWLSAREDAVRLTP